MLKLCGLWPGLLLLATFGLAGTARVAYCQRIRPGWEFRRALHAAEQHDLARVAAAVQVLQTSPHHEPHAHLLRGWLELRRGNPAQAHEEFRLSPPEGRLRPFALLWSGECLYWLGQLHGAAAMLQALIAEQPQHAEAHRWLGAVWNDLGAVDAAVKELERASELAPTDHRPHRLLGQIFYDAKQYAQAIPHFRRAIVLAPQLAQDDVVRELASSLIQQRNYSEALHVLATLPESAVALALQSECLLSLGDRKGAEESLARARRLDPREPAALFWQARWHLAESRVDQAIELLQELVERHPHDDQSRYQLALAHRQRGDVDAAREQIKLFEASRRLHQRYIELCQQASRNPQDAALRDEIADLCGRLGKPDQQAFWRRAAAACRTSQSTQALAAPGLLTHDP